MFDKKIFYTLVTATTVSGFIVICTLGQSLHYQKTEAKSGEIVRRLPEAEYIIREYDGKLGVYRGESATPYRIIDFDTSLLSEDDREELSSGIRMKTEAEVNSYLEDITT